MFSSCVAKGLESIKLKGTKCTGAKKVGGSLGTGEAWGFVSFFQPRCHAGLAGGLAMLETVDLGCRKEWGRRGSCG